MTVSIGPYPRGTVAALCTALDCQPGDIFGVE
ncbi:helix-turn-helix domain-containing protein [Corynebacterium tuberculostearicum]|nr:helix-turn-helix domain-containing protein [Corynebacterium tuberculostearicum]